MYSDLGYVAVLLTFLSACSFGFSLIKGKEKRKINVLERLNLVTENASVDIREAELREPFARRALKPFLKGLSGLLAGLLPAAILEKIQSRLERAGSPGGITPGDFLSAKFFLAALFPLGAFFLAGLNPVTALLLPFTGWYMPDLYLKRLAGKRDLEIERSFPAVLDLLTVSVEAGLGFDGAMARVAEKSGGILAGEFKRVLKEIRMGKNRKEALKDMALRLGHEDVTTFVGAIIQADQLGISFGKVLRVHSEQARHKRKQKIEEAAMKAPVKMLIPLVFFIFPTIFIVLLGPAAIKIFTTLM